MFCDAEALVKQSWVSNAARAACLAATCSQAQVSGPYFATYTVVEPNIWPLVYDTETEFATQENLSCQRSSSAAQVACLAATCS